MSFEGFTHSAENLLGNMSTGAENLLHAAYGAVGTIKADVINGVASARDNLCEEAKTHPYMLAAGLASLAACVILRARGTKAAMEGLILGDERIAMETTEMLEGFESKATGQGFKDIAGLMKDMRAAKLAGDRRKVEFMRYGDLELSWNTSARLEEKKQLLAAFLRESRQRHLPDINGVLRNAYRETSAQLHTFGLPMQMTRTDDVAATLSRRLSPIVSIDKLSF